MPLLIIGDPHVTPDAIPECGKLMDFAIQEASDYKVHTILILGDLYHNHGVVHLSVQKFWKDTFELIKLKLPNVSVVALVGNHDRSGDTSSPEHALMLHNDITVIAASVAARDTLYMPFTPDKNLFIETCKKHPECKYVVAHQEFVGGLYDNGFGISSMAIDPNSIPQVKVISGHIHTTQRFGKVWYPGSPRWRNMNDANVNKYIWVVDDDFGFIEMIPTDGVCKKIEVFSDYPEAPITSIPANSSVTVDVYGTKEHVAERMKYFEGLGCQVRPYPVPEKKIKVKESDGIATAFLKYLNEFATNFDRSKLINMCRERITWMK